MNNILTFLRQLCEDCKEKVYVLFRAYNKHVTIILPLTEEIIKVYIYFVLIKKYTVFYHHWNLQPLERQ